MKAARSIALLVACAALLTAVACGKKTPPVARPTPPPPPPAETAPPRPPAPPEPAREPVSVPPDPVRDDAISSASLDELNKNSPLKPVYFELDSSDLSAANQKTLDEDAALIKRYSSWTVTIEGHCDERGSAEYNLALGERRAMAARTYLISLGIAATRLRTVSYGKEFPFDPGHDEAAFAKNRRAHFVITSK
ncbi:MAG TPA: peptidoglycan-associated lipoprotein Pal [Vicinamibacterales bacterium]|jgi:peptidoglycan-associated lipoprotein|nr:peptidoglycan-associated lipoprotein Pal [Vicinamibacterales bacterium]